MRWRIVVALVAAGLCCGTSAVAAPRAPRTPSRPSLTARPRTAAPGGTVVLYGAGFPARRRVTLLANAPGGEPVPIGRATADGDGEFVAPIAIQRDVLPGRYLASACRQRCKVKATTSFRVRAAGAVTR